MWIEAVTTTHTGWVASCDRRNPVVGEVEDGGESTYA